MREQLRKGAPDAGGDIPIPMRGSRAVIGGSAWWLLAPMAAGVLLRFWGLLRQVLAGDEMHAVLAATSMKVGEILVTYLPTDYCLPLTAVYRALLIAGVPLTEILLRLPVLLSGILVLVLLPSWTERAISRGPAVVLAWLIAVSPSMVYYGRIVRSYMPVVLLGSLAAVAFFRWLERPSWRWGALYVVAGSLAVYFHLGAGPFVVAPFLFWAVGKLVRPAEFPTLRQTALLGGALAVGLVSFLLPARVSLQALIQNRRQEAVVDLGTWKGVLVLQSGTSETLLVSVFWVLAAVGLVALVREKPRLGSYTLLLPAAHAVGLLILSPVAMHQPPIFSRYLLVALPIVLLWVAMGVDVVALRWWRRGWSPLQAAAAAVVPLALFAAGPLLEQPNRSGSFAHRAEFFHYIRGVPPKDGQLPDGYRWLAEQGEGAIIEYPWQFMWRYSRVYGYYQMRHGREVIVAPEGKDLWHPSLHFRNMVPPSPERMLESRASYLVLHLDLEGEEASFDGRPPPPGSPGEQDRERRRNRLNRLSRLARERSRKLTAGWGAPQYASEQVRIWDLDLQRRSESK